jgi:AcrR family transcriptional regulator
MKKEPRQERSRAMVVALLDAAEREVAERGLNATTTNHIAARAGVSIGSLYQYFQDKTALVEALLQRGVSRLIEVLHDRVDSQADAHPRAIMRAVLEAVFDVVESSPTQREIVRNWHGLRAYPAFAALELHVTEACRRYLLRHHDDYRVENLTASLFVGINAVHYTVAHYLSMEDPPISRDEVITSLVDMLTAYLLTARRAPAATGRSAVSGHTLRELRGYGRAFNFLPKTLSIEIRTLIRWRLLDRDSMPI